MSFVRLFLLATSGIVLGLTALGDSGCGATAGTVATGGSCTSDDDCVSDHCSEDICVECLADAHCLSLTNNICSAGQCVECRTDSDCSAGEACAEDGTCATSCTGDSGCPEGQVCSGTFSEEGAAGRCVDSVSCNFDDGTGCPTGLTCNVDNVCR